MVPHPAYPLPGMFLCCAERYRRLPGAFLIGTAGVCHLCIIHATFNTCALIERAVANTKYGGRFHVRAFEPGRSLNSLSTTGRMAMCIWAQSFYPGTVFRFIISHATHGVNLAHIDSGSVDWWAYYLNAVLYVYLANCHTCILAGQ